MSAHMGRKDLLMDYLKQVESACCGRPAYLVAVKVTATKGYTHKGLRNAEAREQRDADAEFFAKEKVLNDGSFCKLVAEEFQQMYRQLLECTYRANLRTLQRVLTGLELGHSPNPVYLGGQVALYLEEYKEAQQALTQAELDHIAAWVKYSRTYKENAVRKMMTDAPGPAKALLGKLLTENINFNEPLRIL
jgi:hypothetical protein